MSESHAPSHGSRIRSLSLSSSLSPPPLSLSLSLSLRSPFTLSFSRPFRCRGNTAAAAYLTRPNFLSPLRHFAIDNDNIMNVREMKWWNRAPLVVFLFSVSFKGTGRWNQAWTLGLDVGHFQRYFFLNYTGFRLYGLIGFILVIWSMVNQILVLNFSDIWSFWLYGQLYQDKTVDHITETRCIIF